MDRTGEAGSVAGEVSRSLLHVLDIAREQAIVALERVLQKRRGVRSGLPDTMVTFRRRPAFYTSGPTAPLKPTQRNELLW
jgi:hypothetical protein